MQALNIGWATVSGYVNLVADNRIVIGTGSYTNRNGDRVFKESVTVFIHENFNGQIPEKGEYVTASGDLYVGPRKDDAQKLNATFNVRFDNQLVKSEPPKRAEAAAEATATTADDDDI